ncbi:Linearmycin resistance permease protein LnrN [Phycisphaerales bacterium]|nr:Linearmycin resistance permease protein LnrN [Phycisphaerales bacterium]
MSAVLALAIKDLRLLGRDWANAFFTFLFPLLLAMFFGWVFSGMYGDEAAGKLEVALVNLDGRPASAAFAKDLTDDEALDVRPAATREEGETMVRKRQVGACVIIPKDFEDNAGSIFAGKTLEIEAVVDPTRSAESGLLTGKLNEIAFRQMQRTFSDPAAMKKSFDSARASLATSEGISGSQRTLLNQMFDSITRTTESFDTGQPGDGAASGMAGWRPIAVKVHKLESTATGPKMPTSSYAVSFPQGVVWGLLGCVMAFAVSIVTERTGGTLLRLTTAPIAKGQILAGKALACFISCLIVQGLLILLAMGPFGVAVPNWGLLLLVVFLTSFGFTGLMMLLAGLSRTEGGAQGLGRAVVLILAMIGGGSIPLFFLSKSVQMLARISPFTWATISIEGVLWRGFSLQDLALPGAVLVCFGVGGYAAGVYAMRWSSAA